MVSTLLVPLAFAFSMASLNVPGPLSAFEVTINVSAKAVQNIPRARTKAVSFRIIVD
jgi:hypothetical protein